ncbi:hypothetical protein BY996DRAFT_6420862 [Phakopsora pachyrhizi]|nr:hypothetical protein BY996DRAFT_6426884 [Phakopsora pachyrhizi]KAI8447568.1 hypothetical protein BY996DRAFT_6420862 [Phakopsora pachyrhizi]
MAYSQLFESLLSEIYVFLNFFAARSHSLVLKIPFRALNVAVTLFQFYAAWAMAWTSICTRVYSKRSYASQVQFWPYKFFRPLVINFFFCSVSIFVTISTPILIYILVDAFHHERSEFDLMLDTLRQGAGVWQTLSASLDSEGVVFAIGSIFAESLKRGHNWTAALLEHASRAKWVSIVWAIMFFVALMLLRIIGAEIKGNPPTVEIGVVSADHNDSQITDHYNQMKLKRGFYYLAVHSSLMILSLMFNIITRIILAVKSFEALVNTTWAIAFSWLILVSGLFSAIATTFQCWRLYVDFDIIIPVEQHDFGSSHNSSIDEGVEEMQETTMAISPSVTKQSYTLVIREEPTMDISPGTRRPSYNPAIREETEPSISD